MANSCIHVENNAIHFGENLVTKSTQLIHDLEQLKGFIRDRRSSGQTIGLVPTMGALHEGHLSLVDHCTQSCNVSVVSIFVNPTQFAPTEDLSRYPRDLDSDVERLSSQNVDVVFAPTDQMMYPEGFSTLVQPPAIAKILEGEFRSSHFQGVVTVVLKLFNLVQPDQAFFGQKDFQQLAVIKKMVCDLNVPVEIIACPIVRDEDGLALSSRNVYLDAEQRRRALSLSNCLQQAQKSIDQGETDAHILMAEMKQSLIDGGVTDIDYAVIANPDTLQVMNEITRPAVLLIAAHVDSTRLIDNRVIE